jgi:DNA-binding transcriptional LysR family regulator
MDTPDRQLRYFLRIAELKSLSRAAEDLDQTQSGLSRQLAALEAHVGKPLFTRTGRGVELTVAGSRLLEGIQPAYQNIDRVLDAVRQQEGVTHGTVRLATVHTLSYYFMADVVASFVSSHEHVNLSVMGRSSPDVVALVESGKADVGFVYDAAVASDNLTSTPLFDDEMCLIVRRDVPLADAVDLGGMPLRLVGFPPHYALRKMIHSAGLQVSSGVGACILPSRIPEKLLTDYGLRKVGIRSPVLRRRVVAITPAQRQPLPLVAELLACAHRIAAA